MSRRLLLGLVLLLGCRHSPEADAESAAAEDGARVIPRGSSHAELCVERGDQYLQMPYDTNGDGAADVIRIYVLVEGGRSRRIVCREADLNSDGVRDTMRTYDDRGRVARDQQDRDFDGRFDYWEYYQDGRLIRTDQDTNGDERIDTRTFFDVQERPSRIERDLAGRSTPGHWQADHFEFFDEGRLTRQGEDVDGDGMVDRWSRDLIYQAERDAREHEAELAYRAERAARTDGGVVDAGVSDAGQVDAGAVDSGAPLAASPDSGIR